MGRGGESLFAIAPSVLLDPPNFIILFLRCCRPFFFGGCTLFFSFRSGSSGFTVDLSFGFQVEGFFSDSTLVWSLEAWSPVFAVTLLSAFHCLYF